MANGNSKKALRKMVEGEHLAANALAIAVAKVKETDLQQLLGQIRNEHETNANEAGKRLQLLGGKYPIPGLRDQLKKGWEGVVTTKNTTDALKLLQKKEHEALLSYKQLLKKVDDEQTLTVLLRNMADSSENVVKLRGKIDQLQSKKKKKGRGRILGIPIFLWLIALGSGAYYYYQQRSKKESINPTRSANGNS
ncbi:MAG: ferritin-like domain-containing protein [Chloroflexota bacterium]|nr:ferritin-like domain-containing protein [Chloroflexota bacterium]